MSPRQQDQRRSKEMVVVKLALRLGTILTEKSRVGHALQWEKQEQGSEEEK